MRTRYINRRIANIVATCDIYNTETKDIDVQKIELPSGVTASKIEKEISKQLPENSKLLDVVTTERVVSTYRMPESMFVELATVVPQTIVVTEY